MSWPKRNIVKNGGFQSGLPPWRGKGIRLVPNPIRRGDVSVRLEERGLLYQYTPGPFRRECSYYLYFRLHNNRRTPKPPLVLASVAHLDRNKQLLRTTPVLVEPPYTREAHFSSYFSIVPPPPAATKYIAVIFQVQNGSVLVDYIALTPHDV